MKTASIKFDEIDEQYSLVFDRFKNGMSHSVIINEEIFNDLKEALQEDIDWSKGYDKRKRKD